MLTIFAASVLRVLFWENLTLKKPDMTVQMNTLILLFLAIGIPSCSSLTKTNALQNPIPFSQRINLASYLFCVHKGKALN